MKKKYKLYKLQPFNFDYKIVDISKEELEWLKLTNLIMKDKKLSKKQLDRFEWLKIKGYYYA